MSSLRISADRAEAGTGDRLLDAARSAILSVGWRRTTATEVARRAGVSRMTLYRTYPDTAALLADLMTREWAQVVGGVEATSYAADGIAEGLVATVRALRGNDLLRRIIEVDPELLLPYLLERRGRSQEAVLDLLADRVARGQAEGGVRRGDPALLARSLVLAAHGWLLSAHTMADDRLGPGELDRELRDLAERYLAP